MSSVTAGISEAASACRAKMQAAGVNEACIRTFLKQHAFISKGETGNIPESSISPVESLDSLEDITVPADPSLLEHLVVLKLNGGLGTGMGLQTAKTLLSVKDGKTFIDFTVLQLEHLRKTYSDHLRFMLMDSFATSSETKAHIKKYSWLFDTFDKEVELIQNRVPKICQDTLLPVTYEADASCEWAPPGHGDLYTALYGSGKLDDLLRGGYKYMFVSNGDNLGATLDARLLAYMKSNQLEFLMEVCRRTESDKKGGHIAYQTACFDDDTAPERRFILRESAQCRKEDEASFQDVEKHRFFNTNNLWVDLAALKKTMDSHSGTLPLPVIRNAKTVNPVDGTSTKVYQLETAMGAAIGLFRRSAAVVVPRERFAPVKTCSDLLALRSDAYVLTEDQRLVLCEERAGKPPTIELDNQHYKIITGLDALVKDGVPSLRQCTKLIIQGPVEFQSGTVVKGEVVIRNSKKEPFIIERDRVLNNEVMEV
ncbi:putative UTP-glucose-1-phosphate uridylyltransferase 2 [Trypanosoma cruzi]|uniref:UTP--glucose-1-phosphate uridylyltransferase n=2 Tax=Trypanosoma cruzi TaxID=5693 RepID=Q4D297_TRYCC|nr:UTP-glucose-1-phosphate uridylyltransferase 2, putative [Trypanosoma cruzi]EAN86649.1 UTP-glucose-1-phosphate uridylyltransferase 2, putative [Trypanosoma cruzi]PWV04491.1 putative UTP-glucose-1-phosphate uridylyltransferase 2 [Trypanosoma cruzi]RNC48834.1 putative UTP-glucose-1-phosphate uridylyltransferase 2 [Trypanosoma cruzi]|eukprot:XP_808500.1 UTP-glucose-1-phosphate uridylyltransferase 2 [Trypanosoma cruzi strain CL Brener]